MRPGNVPAEFQARVSDDGKIIRLANLNLTTVPEWLRTVKAATILDLNFNKLTALPEWLGDLTKLTTLYVGSNDLATLPYAIGNLTALTDLYLSGNRLVSLPDTIGNLTMLTELALQHNRLAALPDSIGNLTALTSLNLYSNRLTTLPDAIGNLTALAALDLQNNGLTVLPNAIAGLTSLTEFNLRNNKLEAIPDTIGNLTALTTLDLWSNQLVVLPMELGDMLADGLHLLLNQNPLADPLPQLVERGAQSLATYLQSLDDAKPQYEAKVLFVGEGSVGKSSLLAALRGEPFLEERPTTHGIEIWPLTLPHPALDVRMTLRSWDFGGQIVYRVTHQFFLTPRALYLVVWNARKGHEQDDVEGWLRRIKLRVGDEAPVIIVATHCAERFPELDYRQLDQDFPGMLAGFFKIDNRTGQGVPELRDAMAIEAGRLPQMGQMISPRWIGAREKILALAAAEPQIRYEQLADICARCRMTDSEALTLAQLMHDLGQIIYYGDDDGLKDVVVLNPEWLTKAISYVLEDEPTRDCGGILDHRRLRAIWQDALGMGGYQTRYHPYFLRLMEKFDVSYRLEGDEQHSLVAQLVPHERPELPWQRDTLLQREDRRLTMVCQLSEPAPGLISWLTVRHHRASANLHWRRGLFLRHPIEAYASEALLEMLSPVELALEVRAPSPDLYFNVLRDSIEDLICNRWPGLDYKLFILCPTDLPSGTKCHERIPIDGLLKLREKGHTKYLCIQCAESHDISLLVTGFAIPSHTFATSFRQLSDQLDRIEGGVLRTEGLAAESAEIVRRILQVVSAEVTDCPTLFSLTEDSDEMRRKARFYQKHYRLTLWCEHPGHWHFWPEASYDLDPSAEWFTKVTPYLKFIFKTLQVLVPLAGSIAVASLPSEQIESADAHLEVMRTVLDNLPDKFNDSLIDTDLGEFGRQGRYAEGAGLRAIRAIIFEKDPLRAFGGLRRVQDPSGDFLWVCKNHYREYDPGLPTLP